MTRRLGLLVVALACAACGPAPPFELTVRAVPGDVAYGAQSTPTPAPTPQAPVALAPGAPPLLYGAPAPIPATTFAPTAAATPKPTCPAAPVDAVPALDADPSATVPPVEHTYLWHESGAYQIGGGASEPFPALFTHAVANVTAPDATGSYSFDVTTTAGGVTGLQRVTDSYQVIPPPQNTTQVQGVGTTAAAGLYLTAVAVQDSGLPTQRVEKFAPPILLMQFPGTDMPTWTTAGHDSVSQDTLTLSGAVTGHVKVDACGTVIDAWEVHATGSLVGPMQNLSLDLTYDVATQFGGLIVGEVTKVTGTELAGGAMQNVTSSVTAATSVLPQRRTS